MSRSQWDRLRKISQMVRSQSPLLSSGPNRVSTSKRARRHRTADPVVANAYSYFVHVDLRVW